MQHATTTTSTRNLKVLASLLTLLACLLTLGLLGSGPPRKMELQEYLRWLNDPQNGLTVQKSINGLELKMKYLAPEYLAQLDEKKEGKRFGAAQRDSLIRNYRQHLTFALTLAPGPETGGDVISNGIFSQAEFTQRVNRLNFGMHDLLKLKTSQGEWPPVLASLENTYGLTGYRTILLVFPATGNDAGPLDVVFRDELFGTGISHFVFDPEVLTARQPAIEPN
jgi:hypothetical protein